MCKSLHVLACAFAISKKRGVGVRALIAHVGTVRPRFRELRSAHLDQAEVVTVVCGRCVVNRNRCSASWCGAVLHLDPIGVSGGREVLMNDTLSSARSSRNRPIIIVAHGKHPR